MNKKKRNSIIFISILAIKYTVNIYQEYKIVSKYRNYEKLKISINLYKNFHHGIRIQN